VRLEAAGEAIPDPASFLAPGIRVIVRPLGEQADWRADAELVFALDEGLTVGYRGFYDCEQT
jgi:hypothetical protein